MRGQQVVHKKVGHITRAGPLRPSCGTEFRRKRVHAVKHRDQWACKRACAGATASFAGSRLMFEAKNVLRS